MENPPFSLMIFPAHVCFKSGRRNAVFIAIQCLEPGYPSRYCLVTQSHKHAMPKKNQQMCEIWYI